MELSRIQDIALHNYYIIYEVIEDQMDNIRPNGSYSFSDHHVDNNVILITVCWWQFLDVGDKKIHYSDIFLFFGDMSEFYAFR